jgi:hypothetical protein
MEGLPRSRQEIIIKGKGDGGGGGSEQGGLQHMLLCVRPSAIAAPKGWSFVAAVGCQVPLCAHLVEHRLLCAAVLRVVARGLNKLMEFDLCPRLL